MHFVVVRIVSTLIFEYVIDMSIPTTRRNLSTTERPRWLPVEYRACKNVAEVSFFQFFQQVEIVGGRHTTFTSNLRESCVLVSPNSLNSKTLICVDLRAAITRCMYFVSLYFL